MAFGHGRETGNAISFKRYVGCAPVKVVAVNPTKEEWKKWMGSELTKDVEYTGVNSDNVKTARLTLLVQPDKGATQDGIEPIIPITFRFTKLPVKGINSGKYKVIDKYGRTAWVTKEELDNKQIPQYSNGPADIDKDFRALVQGEEAITNFLKVHLSIPAVKYLDKSTNQIINHPNPSECEARLDHIMRVFDGDFKEIKTNLSYQKDNHTKVLFGVKNADGKEYQDVFMDLFLNINGANTRFATALAESLANRQMYASTYFGEKNPDGSLIIAPLHEFTVTPSSVTPSNSPVPSSSPMDLPPVSTEVTPLSENPATEGDDDLPF